MPSFGGGVPKMPARVSAPRPQPPRYYLSGQTQDQTLAPLADCAVKVFDTITGRLVGNTTSDATGLWILDVTGTQAAGDCYVKKHGAELAFFATAHAPDGTKAGATVNTLTGTPA